MKKVTIGEKAFIIGIVSLVGGFASVLAKASIVGAGVIGLGFGILGVAVIGLLHKVRS